MSEILNFIRNFEGGEFFRQGGVAHRVEGPREIERTSETYGFVCNRLLTCCNITINAAVVDPDGRKLNDPFAEASLMLTEQQEKMISRSTILDNTGTMA